MRMGGETPDLDRLLGFLELAGIGYARHTSESSKFKVEVGRQAIVLEDGHAKVGGYSRFFALFDFDGQGGLISVVLGE